MQDYIGEAPPLKQQGKSGASEPMAIALRSFESQFAEFGEACKTGRTPACSGEDGYKALELVEAIYTSCREGRQVALGA